MSLRSGKPLPSSEAKMSFFTIRVTSVMARTEECEQRAAVSTLIARSNSF